MNLAQALTDAGLSLNSQRELLTDRAVLVTQGMTPEAAAKVVLESALQQTRETIEEIRGQMQSLGAGKVSLAIDKPPVYEEPPQPKVVTPEEIELRKKRTTEEMEAAALQAAGNLNVDSIVSGVVNRVSGCTVGDRMARE
ncbi:MAG TPA: hypothetical protein VM537_02050 [Anaerolineae bacterium]|nr:hypothetical protein [Anaerolineae bacterium]